MQKLKIKSKKLISGKFQIDFSTEGISDNYYGYLLAEPKTLVSDVMRKIEKHLHEMTDEQRYLQRNLFSLGKREVNSGKILIFKKTAA